MKTPRILGSYQNGNTFVVLQSDGTKIRTTQDKEFRPEFPDTLDINITNKCDGGCPFCYNSSTKEGNHGILFDWEGNPCQEWMKSLRPFTEVAINVNDLSHPQLKQLLVYLRQKQVVTNITINQKHFERPEIFSALQGLHRKGLFFGIGVSIGDDTLGEEFFQKLKCFDHAVVHVVAGVVERAQLMQMFNRDLRLLILGFKFKGRGDQYGRTYCSSIEYNLDMLRENIRAIVELKLFKVVAFDNLALRQLNIKRRLFEDTGKLEDWDAFYSGDDGTHTFYIDAVSETFAQSSIISDPDKIWKAKGKTIDEMFKIVQENGRNQ